MSVQPPAGQGPQGPAPVPPPGQPQYAQPRYAQPRTPGPSKVPGVVAIVLGSLGILLALFVLILPYIGFILGGGGDTARFDEMAAGFAHVALVIFIVSLVVLTLGIVLTVRAGRRRRELFQAAQRAQNPQVPGPAA